MEEEQTILSGTDEAIEPISQIDQSVSETDDFENGTILGGKEESEHDKTQEKTEEPAVGEYVYTPPEGFTIDETELNEFTEYAKSKGISPEVYKELIDKHASIITTISEKTEEARKAEAKAQSSEWLKELKADPELGGADFGKNMSYARKAMDTFGGEPFKQTLIDAGLGNNPTVIKALYNIGKAVSEGEFVGGVGAKEQIPVWDKIFKS